MTKWLLVALASGCGAPPPPLAGYTARTVHGWSVYVAHDVEDAEVGSRAVALLERKLGDVAAVLPEPALAKVRQVPLWLDLADPACPAACYLGLPAGAKVDGVELANAQNFIDYTDQQPWIVLHELAHGYHSQVLGVDDVDIVKTYEAVLASGKLEAVHHVTGPTLRHYGLTNAVEFFAEMTETFFGKNDYAPFDRAELADQLPEVERLMREKWSR